MSLFEIKNKIKIRTCRICLDTQHGDMISIEEQNGWLALFESCFGITLTTQDVPRLLCLSCAEKVQNYVKFKDKCMKSHNLWKLVISDVKCYVVKLDNAETNENTNVPVTNEPEIKDEPFQTSFGLSFESDNFSNYDDNKIDRFSIEIKMETQEEDTQSRVEESKENKNDNLFRNTDKSEHMKHKSVNSNGNVKKIDTDSLNRTEKKSYNCSQCNESYAKKAWYDKHKKIGGCQPRRPKKEKIIYNQDYSYDLGRKYDDQNITNKIKREPQSKTVIIGNENDSLFSCGLCYHRFPSAKDSFIHLNSHWSSNELACKLCDFVGIDLAAIICHRYSHLPRNKLRFKCHICEKNQYSLMTLHFHYREVHLKKPGGYCSRCNIEYKKVRYWKLHERGHVPFEFTCDICKKGFVVKSALKAHIIDHMRLVPAICDICGVVLSRQRYIKAHKQAVHGQTERLKCTHCDKTFKNRYTLIDHQKRCVMAKTLKCEVCDKGFAAPGELKQHMICHSVEKPFKCDHCGGSFLALQEVAKHFDDHQCVNDEIGVQT